MSGNFVKMPEYRLKKTVFALKVGAVITDSSMFQPEDPAYAPISYDLTKLPCPNVGDYYVVYADGTRSFMTSTTFEALYEEC